MIGFLGDILDVFSAGFINICFSWFLLMFGVCSELLPDSNRKWGLSSSPLLILKCEVSRMFLSCR